jgi:hypothetical protein
MNLLTYHSELDPLYVLTPPKEPVETLFTTLRMKLIATLATYFNTFRSLYSGILNLPNMTMHASWMVAMLCMLMILFHLDLTVETCHLSR